MSYELKQNEGSAFKNKRKEKDGHPDFTGEFNVNGKLHWFDVWQNTTKNGDTYFKARIREKDVKPQARTAPAPAAQTRNNLDDEVPW